jgi:hypothetical protein
MERRIRFFEQMRHRLETIKDENLELEAKDEGEEKNILMPTGKQDYIVRLKTMLSAWGNELNKWEDEADQVNIDEDCAAHLAKLDQKLAEGYEKMRDILGTTEEDWDGVRKDAETLREDIISTFEQIRRCVGGQ